MRVPEKGAFHKHGIFRVCEFLVRRTRLGAPVHYEKGSTTLYKKVAWGAQCTCSARVLNLHLYSFFQRFWPNLWSHGVQTGWVAYHHGLARVIVLSDPERCKVNVPYGGGALSIRGIFPIDNFFEPATPNSIVVTLDKIIRTLCEEVI